jgi:hypothetical protein
MSKHTEQADPSGPRITRRGLLVKGSAALVGTTLLGFPFDLTRAQEMTGDDLKRRGVRSKDGGTKPTFLPDEGSRDPVAHSVAENLFWNE